MKEKTAVVSTIEDALANAKQCIDVCKAMSRSNKAAMITALATENGDYDVDEDEMESLRDARNIDMGEKKKERWRNGWKEDRLLYLQTLELRGKLGPEACRQGRRALGTKVDKTFCQVVASAEERIPLEQPPRLPARDAEEGRVGDDAPRPPAAPRCRCPGDRDDHGRGRENEKFAYKTQIHYRYGDGTYLVRFLAPGRRSTCGATR